MSFQSKITSIGTDTIPTYSQQLFDKQKAAAETLFDENLETEIKEQLKANNINVYNLTEVEWGTFIAARLTLFTVTDTKTSVISLDATLDGGNNVTDIGTILAEWEGDGYTTTIVNPVNNVTSFE
ncbi:MAG: hypothetical protein GWP19_00810 [Planctomycetia bacterium]|nr:hypothetical protein [Planctomycetia bacterium]